MYIKKFFCIVMICLGMINTLPRYEERCAPHDEECKNRIVGEIHRINNIKTEERDPSWKNPNLPFWTQIKYAGDCDFPSTDLKKIRSYPMNFFEFNSQNKIIDKETGKVLEGMFLN